MMMDRKKIKQKKLYRKENEVSQKDRLIFLWSEGGRFKWKITLCY